METRKRIWLRDGGRCVDCGRVVDIAPGAGQMEIDHATPLWAGGRDDDANRVTRCTDCHASKTAAEAAERARIDRTR